MSKQEQPNAAKTAGQRQRGGEPFDPERTIIGPIAPPKRAPREEPAAQSQVLQLADILDSPYQPRQRQLTKKEVAELMASIEAAGQVTPILVSPAAAEQTGKYYVHSGHRRCAALRFLDQQTVLAIVRPDMSEREARKVALADNLGREDLTAFEQAVAVRDYAHAFDLDFESAGRELGVPQRTAYRLKAILAAPEKVQTLIREHAIAAKAADVIARMATHNERRAIRVGEKYAAGKLTTAELEEEAKKSGRPTRGATSARDVALAVDERLVTLKLRVVRQSLSDAQRERVSAALAQVIAHLGIARVEAANLPGVAG